MRDCDVLVIGSGAAGLCAAISAADSGASVMLLEAAGRFGGSTRLSGGVVYAAGTSVQADVGIEDDADAMFHYYMTLNRWNIEPAIARRLSDESGPAVHWLMQLGLRFPVEALYRSGVDDVARGHQAEGAGEGLFEGLLGAASARGVEMHPGIRVDALIEEDGRVSGVRAQGGEIRAGAVVVACGGYGANPDILARFNPAVAAHGQPWVYYFGSETNQGDAFHLGEGVGAATAGEGRLLVNATPAFSRDPADFHPPWLIFVNLDGRRFMDETAPYAVAGHLIEAQREGRCFAIIDAPTLAQAPRRHPFADKLGVGDFAYSEDRILEEAARGRVKVADTLEGLAAATGIDAEALQGTVEAYNRDAQNGGDSRFLKQGPLRPVETGPFYAVEVRATSYGATSAGLRINADAEVISQREQAIPGLFAAGEATGGVLGDRYVGGGNYLSSAIVFGRLAGLGAARAAARTA